jgi:hypothetical protein
VTIAGCDYAFSVPPIADLKAAGIEFVVRYVSTDPSKNLTASEVAMLHGAGIAIVLVWETEATEALKGYNQGVADARAARGQADALGFPKTLPIYYAVDFQDTLEQALAVLDYLHGASDAEGSKNLVGVYGGYETVHETLGSGFIYAWQTYAWSNGVWDDRAVLRQTHNGQSIGSVDVDLDAAMTASYGQWPAPSSGGAPAPVSSRPTLVEGATGTWVQVLQRSLMLAGQNPQGVDANFGAHTLAAVRAFQSAAKLAVDGQVGPVTWGALEARTEAVQKALNAAGANLVVDGVAGLLTRTAVTAFQAAHHLAVDGIVGPQTSAALHL